MGKDNTKTRTGENGGHASIIGPIVPIFVPKAHDHSDLRQGSRALAGPDFLSMYRVIVSYCHKCQPIRFARFDGKSVNRGLPVLDKAKTLDPCRRLDYEQSLCFLIVRRERSEKNWPRESRPHESCCVGERRKKRDYRQSLTV